MDHAHVAEHEHGTGGSTYIKIAAVLFVLTALEVLLYEVCYGESLTSMASLGQSLAPYFVELLLLLSAFKFWFVAMFYMHLKYDLKPLTWFFSFSLLIAVLITFGLVALFHYNRTLWWVGAPW